MPRGTLDKLEELRLEIQKLELPEGRRARLKVLKRERDVLILDALKQRIPERNIASAAGVTRGWLWRLKNRLPGAAR